MKLPVSVCLITKNSENTILKCLKSISSFLEEIIILDTGSTDKTLDICHSVGNGSEPFPTIKIHEIKWENDFSIARNKIYDYFPKQWILWIDSDEEIVIRNIDKLYEEIKSTEYDSFFVTRYEIFNNDEKAETTRCRILKTENKYLFEGVIHETPKVNFKTTKFLDKNIIYLNHYGYNKEFFSPEDKSKRNISILEKLVNSYENIDSWEKIQNAVYLLNEINENYKLNEKINLINKIENVINSFSDEELRKNICTLNFYYSAIQINKIIDNKNEVFKYIENSSRIFPDDITLNSIIGDFYFGNGYYNKAIEYYYNIIKLVGSNSYLKNVFIHEGLKNYGTFYNIALCFYHLKNEEESKKFIELALKVNPKFEPALKFKKKYKF